MSYPELGISRSLKDPIGSAGQYGFTPPSSYVTAPSDYSNIRDLDSTPYFMRHPRIGGDRSRVYYRSNPIGQQKDPILGVLPASALKNGAQKTYVEGDILFASTKLRDGNRVTVLNVCYLNSILEEACVINKGNYVGQKRAYESMLNLDRIKIPDSDKEEMYCSSVQEFSEKWQYAGPLLTQIGDVTDRERIFTVVMGRAAKVPNLWGRVIPGDRVGFVVKEVKNTYANRHGPLGEVISGPTPGKILQLVPHTTSWRKYPPHFTATSQNSSNLDDSINSNDITFVKSKTFTSQKLYKTHTQYIPEEGIYPGMVDMTSDSETESHTSTVVDVVESGLYIPVGIVTEVNNIDPPSESEIRDALRIPACYKKLLANNKLEITVTRWI